VASGKGRDTRFNSRMLRGAAPNAESKLKLTGHENTLAHVHTCEYSDVRQKQYLRVSVPSVSRRYPEMCDAS
jgi:hypothetical protein